MSNCSTRSSSRVGRVPEKIRKSPPKKPAIAKIKATKNQEDPIEYDIKVISTCRCEVTHRALCHFVGYNKSEDEWRPFHEMSEAAVGIAATGPTKCSPKYCQRRKILMSSGSPDSLVHTPEISGSDCPLAMQFLNNLVASPKQKTSKPPVPLFPPSYPSPPPSPPSPFHHNPLSPPFLPSQPSPACAGREEVVFANPMLSLAIADSMREALPSSAFCSCARYE